MLNFHVIFSHGKDSHPNATKIQALMEVADSLRLNTTSLDYRGVDDPEVRVEQLVSFARQVEEPLMLVGSSMGAYVSLRASQKLDVNGLFLMAPAVLMPGYDTEDTTPRAAQNLLIHGWQDEIVPVTNAIRFAEMHRCELLLLDDDHRLSRSVDRLCKEFLRFCTAIYN